MNYRLIGILISIIFLTACSSSSPIPSPTVILQPTAVLKATNAPAGNQPLVSTVKPGSWGGAGDNNFTISFTVGEGGNSIVKGLQVTFKATCGTNASNITDTLAGTENIALKAGEFKFTNANYEITGKAIAADRIEGTLKAEGISLGKLGQCRASGIVWSASPK
jgi:hypothetical protein